MSVELVARGHVEGKGAQDGAREAFAQALAAARRLGIKHVRGDNLDPRVTIPAGVTVEHINTHENRADPFTKAYPDWFEHKATTHNALPLEGARSR